MRVVLTGFVDVGPLRGNKGAVLVEAARLRFSFFGVDFEECHDFRFLYFFEGQRWLVTLFSSSLPLGTRPA